MRNVVCNVAIALMLVSLFVSGAAPVFGAKSDPNMATRDPYPADGQRHVAAEPFLVLSWSLGDVDTEGYSVRYEVYLGVNEVDVADAETSSPEYMGDTEATTLGITGLEPETYYWRVDIRLTLLRPPFSMIVIEGEVWSFGTVPEQAWDPDPADGADDVEVDPNVTLSWKLGDIDEDVFTYQRYYVYFGTDFNEVSQGWMPDFTVDEGTSLEIGPLLPQTTYYWRIDTGLITTRPPHVITVIEGDVWSFSTVAPPPRTITVDDDAPADFNNIQAAIDDANDGDTVEVRPGRYTGPGNRDIDFRGKAITVRSQDPNDPYVVAATIVDCNAAPADPHWGFHIHDNNESLSVIAGLTITDSYVEASDGGAIRCENSVVSIYNCVLFKNEAVMFCPVGGCWGGYGAAIYCADSNALITACTVVDNTGESAVAFSNSNAVVTGCALLGNDASALFCYESGVQISDSSLSSNQAWQGGALEVGQGCVVTIDYCTMTDNQTYDSGGAVLIEWYPEQSTVTISHSTLTGNSSDGYRQGGAIMCLGGVLTLIDSELADNCTNNAGGAVFCGGELTISGCTITGNQAGVSGGGIAASCPMEISNSFVGDNTAGYSGGGIAFAGGYGSLAITNCIMAYNEAEDFGGGLCFGGETNATVTNSTFIRNLAEQFGGGISISGEDADLALANSILWANIDSSPAGQSQQIYDDSTNAPAITYSCIQDWDAGGMGNISADPCFADPNNDDFHLKSEAGRWDASSQDWVYDGVTSPCIDAGNPGSGLGDEPSSASNVRINMGAYGGTTEAGKTPYGWGLLADLTNDRIVNFQDFSGQAANWQESQDQQPGDLNRNGIVNIADVNHFAEGWLERPPSVPRGMAYIPRGTFEMGDSLNEGRSEELPVHSVTVDSFFIGKYEVTNRQYCNYLNSALAQGLITVTSGTVEQAGSSYDYCDTYGADIESQIDYNDVTGVFSVRTKVGRDMSNDPMVEVTWYGAAAYCNWLSGQEGYEMCYDPCATSWPCDFSKKGYRLPTEAEWEYAARGGLWGKRYPWGDSISQSLANYVIWGPGYNYHPDWDDGVSPYTSPVGSFPASGYALYDMAGNVWDWCNDWLDWPDYDYYENSPAENPTGPATGTSRVVRGGSWLYDEYYCRVAIRGGNGPSGGRGDRGFRIVLPD